MPDLSEASISETQAKASESLLVFHTLEDGKVIGYTKTEFMNLRIQEPEKYDKILQSIAFKDKQWSTNNRNDLAATNQFVIHRHGDGTWAGVTVNDGTSSTFLGNQTLAKKLKEDPKFYKDFMASGENKRISAVASDTLPNGSKYDVNLMVYGEGQAGITQLVAERTKILLGGSLPGDVVDNERDSLTSDATKIEAKPQSSVLAGFDAQQARLEDQLERHPSGVSTLKLEQSRKDEEDIKGMMADLQAEISENSKVTNASERNAGRAELDAKQKNIATYASKLQNMSLDERKNLEHFYGMLERNKESMVATGNPTEEMKTFQTMVQAKKVASPNSAVAFAVDDDTGSLPANPRAIQNQADVQDMTARVIEPNRYGDTHGFVKPSSAVAFAVDDDTGSLPANPRAIQNQADLEDMRFGVMKSGVTKPVVTKPYSSPTFTPRAEPTAAALNGAPGAAGLPRHEMPGSSGVGDAVYTPAPVRIPTPAATPEKHPSITIAPVGPAAPQPVNSAQVARPDREYDSPTVSQPVALSAAQAQAVNNVFSVAQAPAPQPVPSSPPSPSHLAAATPSNPVPAGFSSPYVSNSDFDPTLDTTLNPNQLKSVQRNLDAFFAQGSSASKIATGVPPATSRSTPPAIPSATIKAPKSGGLSYL